MDLSETFQSIKDFFAKKTPLPPGLISYQTPPSAPEQYQLHLRTEKDGTGILIVNAATVLHLNQTAVEFAYHLIRETEKEKAVEQIAQRYRIDKKQISQDYDDFVDKVLTLLQTEDLDPVSYLDMERQEPYSGEISAPYRLDCALTYRVGQASHPDHAPTERVTRELETDEWIIILHKVQNAAIPHIIFTGGEPTLRDDLPDLIGEAEKLGMVTGLLSDGLRLGDPEYRQALLLSGLDHLMMIIDPNNLEIWQILENVLAEDLYTTVHLTLHQGEDLKPYIKRLAELGANSLSLSTIDKDLSDALQDLRDYAAIQQLDLVWDLPVPYSWNNPVSIELERSEPMKLPKGAGKAWLYVEPDGDVLPAQGLCEQILGNILEDSWEDIWKKT
ncbi:MAG: PqqD family peptide modification chaperone [Brevefilum sp.]|jgi:MoaA/NifB/PqqE/SkfB family radical SAM enzyme